MFGLIIKCSRAVLMSAGILVGLYSTSVAQGLGAYLEAVPQEHHGKCPATITFNGTISLDRPGTVRYRFIRSDRARGPFFSLKFNAAGQQNVSTTWRLGGARLRHYEGWEAIQIVYPAAMLSNRAHFKMNCQE